MDDRSDDPSSPDPGGSVTAPRLTGGQLPESQPLPPTPPIPVPPTPENLRDAQTDIWFLAARFLKWAVVLLIAVSLAVAVAVVARC